MRFEQVRDVLRHARQFHQLLAEFYQRSTDATQKMRLRLLLEYLSKREQRLEKFLCEYEEKSTLGMLNTWFRSSACTEKMKQLQTLMQKMPTCDEEIIPLVIKVDNCLIDMYDRLYETAQSPTIRGLLKDLVDIEKREERIAVRDLQRMEDL